MHVLTICGSLRRESSNAALLDAVALVAPDDVVVRRFDGLAAIPAFNPDDEMSDAPAPAAVTAWRAAIASSDAVLISSPEYAHGIPGALKNALDWIVGSGELVFRRVGLINVSASSRFAHPQLVEVLTVMNATVVSDATLLIDLPRRGLDARAIADDHDLAPTLRRVIDALVRVPADATGEPANA